MRTCFHRPQTRIRIRFTDRSQLESVFPSTDTLTAIYEFVKCSIEEKHRQKPFVLCKLEISDRGCVPITDQ